MSYSSGLWQREDRPNLQKYRVRPDGRWNRPAAMKTEWSADPHSLRAWFEGCLHGLLSVRTRGESLQWLFHGQGLKGATDATVVAGSYLFCALSSSRTLSRPLDGSGCPAGTAADTADNLCGADRCHGADVCHCGPAAEGIVGATSIRARAG